MLKNASALLTSDRKPVCELTLSRFDLTLFFLLDRKLIPRVCLRYQVVLASLVLHYLWQRLLMAYVKLKSEVPCHQVVLPTREIGCCQVSEVVLRQVLRMCLPLECNLACGVPKKHRIKQSD